MSIQEAVVENLYCTDVDPVLTLIYQQSVHKYDGHEDK